MIFVCALIEGKPRRERREFVISQVYIRGFFYFFFIATRNSLNVRCAQPHPSPLCGCKNVPAKSPHKFAKLRIYFECFGTGFLVPIKSSSAFKCNYRSYKKANCFERFYHTRTESRAVSFARFLREKSIDFLRFGPSKAIYCGSSEGEVTQCATRSS